MNDFRLVVNKKHNLQLENYDQLYQWSIDNVAGFWGAVWEFTNIIHSVPYTMVVDESKKPNEVPEWFSGARLNLAENMLWCNDDRKAIIATTEHAGGHKEITYRDLHEQVRICAAALRASGVVTGDRVVGYISNCIEAVIIYLAVQSIGAIWSSTSPDFGVQGVLERFVQINPKIIFSVNAVHYNGKVHDHISKLKAVVQGLPDLEKVVVINFVPSHKTHYDGLQHIDYHDFLKMGANSDGTYPPLVFEQLPFNHPSAIMFSSGTTGQPKCIVHCAGGPLLQHKKEHIVQGNLGRNDIVFQFTTTGWMMWAWLLSCLSVGSTIVLFDGSPFKPDPLFLWRLVDEVGITAFGTSAKYIASLEEGGIKPGKECKLTTLKYIYSTGSPLKPESFDYVYRDIKSDVLLGSITGGTDIVSLFACHNTTLPVYRGEIQCRGLGMAVECWNESGKPLMGYKGDLVCSRAFPCQPVFFWNDKDGSKYRKAYFDQFPGVWYHGDFLSINPKTGGVLMLGRSDGTLNPNGVRIGTAELYNLVEKYDEVADCLVVGQKYKDDERVILFLKMKENHEFTHKLVEKLKHEIRHQLSPRHVPSFILPITEIPYTINGKKVEVAVKKIISGENVVPSGAIANPACLDLFKNIPELMA